MSNEDTLQDAKAPVAADDESSRASRHNRIRSVETEESVHQSNPMDYDYTNFYFGAGDDAFAMLEPTTSTNSRSTRRLRRGST